MSVCKACGGEFENSGEKQFQECVSCRRKKLKLGWKRQMRFYGILIAVGVALLAYVIPEFRSNHYSLADSPVSLLGGIVLGGLGLLGGLFGFSLALFFHYWHGRSKSAPEH